LTAGIVSVLSFGFNERVVTHATATLKAWEANEFGPIPKESSLRANIYVTDGMDIMQAAHLTGSGDQIEMSDVTWYDRNASGRLVRQVRAAKATYAAPGWQLENATVFDVNAAQSQLVKSIIVGQTLSPKQIELDSVDPDTQSFFELSRSISAYEAAGRRTAEMRAKWWHKMSGPLSAFLMPLLGAVAAFGLARSGQLFLRAIIGMGLGFAYFVIDNAALAMGSFGGYPPFLAAWAPFLLFLLVGETVLVKTEE